MDRFAILCRDTRNWMGGQLNYAMCMWEVPDAVDAVMFPTWQSAARACPEDGRAYAVIEFHCTMQNGRMHD